MVELSRQSPGLNQEAGPWWLSEPPPPPEPPLIEDSPDRVGFAAPDQNVGSPRTRDRDLHFLLNGFHGSMPSKKATIRWAAFSRRWTGVGGGGFTGVMGVARTSPVVQSTHSYIASVQ